VVAGILVVPLGLRAIAAAVRSPKAVPSYIPAIESPRERPGMDDSVIAKLRGAQPDFIIIGNSMARSRISTVDLSRLVGGNGVIGLFEAARESAYWYLAFKNWIVEPGIRPRAVIIFFRDQNLTDPMFRLWPGTLDRVAHDSEPRLNAILAARVHGTYHRWHTATQAVYQWDVVRAWLEPMLVKAPLALAADGPDRTALADRMNDEVFALKAMRQMAAADMAAADDAALDFHRFLPMSVLPEIIRLSKESGIRVGFVRVQRRPDADGPPPQSRALQRYVADLAAYLAANGADFHDDWGDPDLPLEIYADGDHVKDEYRDYYTRVLFRKAPGLFR
jgi:hypothetical protein